MIYIKQITKKLNKYIEDKNNKNYKKKFRHYHFKNK